MKIGELQEPQHLRYEHQKHAKVKKLGVKSLPDVRVRNFGLCGVEGSSVPAWARVREGEWLQKDMGPISDGILACHDWGGVYSSVHTWPNLNFTQEMGESYST